MAFYYNKTKLPFDFTPQIFRYLEKLIDIAENTWADETGDEISIDNYLLGEPKNPEIQLNNGEFWHFLEKMGAIKVSEGKLKPGMEVDVEIVESGGIKTFHFSKTYLRILDIKKVRELLTERGESTIIRTETLELLAQDIAQYKTGPKLVDLLKRCGVPTKMIVYPNTKWRTILGAFRVLSTSANPQANRILYKVIEATVHPLFFDGDKNKAIETQKKYSEWLKYDHVVIEDGKIYIGPTKEEWDNEIFDWVDADGNVVEPEGSELYPSHLAELWVLWNQIIVLVSAYQNNPTLDRKELEKLYFEVIGKTENLIEHGKLFRLKEKYKRPFTSLSTAEVEAQAKKAGGPLELIGAFLIEITALNPNPAEIGKEMEKSSELIGRITNATRTTTEKQENEKGQSKSQKIIDALDDALIRGFQNMSFGPHQPVQQATQKMEITAMPKLIIDNQDKPMGKKSNQNQEMELHLNNIGDLFREPRDRYCYPMGEESGRHKIIRFLATNKGHSQTSTISSELNDKSEQSIRTEIGKINDNFQEFIKPKPKNSLLIEGRKGSGYRINPKFKIIIQNK